MSTHEAAAKEIVGRLYWRGRTWTDVEAEVRDDGGLSEMLGTPPCPTADADMIGNLSRGLRVAIAAALEAERRATVLKCAAIADEKARAAATMQADYRADTARKIRDAIRALAAAGA